MNDAPKCRRCGADVEPGALFCSRCGQDMTMLGDESPTLEMTTAGTPVTPVRSTLRQALRDATLGEYEVLSELGRGGMATVFLAHDISLDRKVAIKVMAPHLLEGEGMAERFKLEARTAAQLSHPHIIPIYAVKETAETLFFVMKYVEGRGLDEVIKKTGALPIPMVKEILEKVGSALGYAHRRDVVHRDIKPGNIMIDEEGIAIVTDFGIAKVAETKGLTMTGTTIGTPSYMSPEQCSAKQVAGASDQYSLGIVAFEMLTGKLPFEGDSAVTTMYKHCHEDLPPIEDFRPDCPPELRDIVIRMTAKDPVERWPSMEAAVRQLTSESTPTGGLDPIRSQLLELVEKGDADELLAKLSDPGGPVVTGPRARTSGTAAATPRQSRKGVAIAAGVLLAVGIGGTLAITKPWAAGGGGDSSGAAAMQNDPAGAEPETPSDRSANGGTSSDPGDRSQIPPTDVADGGGETGTEPTVTAQTPDPVQPAASGGGGDHTPARPSVASVDLSGPSAPLTPGETAGLSATPIDAAGRPVSGQSVQWTSSNDRVASVDASGTVRAVGPGQATITASTSGISATYAISVGEIPVASIMLGSSSVTLGLGDTQTLSVETRAADGSALDGRQVSWRSSNPGVASVSGTGVVTAATEGIASITATSGNASASADVTVRLPTERAVENVVAAYALALESRDVDQVRAVYPGMTAARAEQLDDAFPDMEGLQVRYTIDSVQEDGDTATAMVSTVWRFRGAGRDQNSPLTLRFTFARTPTSWRLRGIEQQ